MTEETQTDTTKPADPVKITGEFTADPNMCKFVVNRTLLDEWTLVFDSAEDGKGSPLIDALFAVEGVTKVKVTGGVLTVTKDVPDAWPTLAQKIVPAIREIISEGVPPISEEAVKTAQQAPVGDLTETIERLFESHINPALASHGGFVRLVKILEGDIHLEMGGGCQGCASSKATLRDGIENAIREVAPGIRNIVDVTDHAAGENPYYD